MTFESDLNAFMNNSPRTFFNVLDTIYGATYFVTQLTPMITRPKHSEELFWPTLAGIDKFRSKINRCLSGVFPVSEIEY